VANISSNIKIIDSNYVTQNMKQLQRQQLQSPKGIQRFFSDKSVSIQSVETEEEGQSKININKLSQHYIRNKINLTPKSFTLQMKI